jgi:hypothetical protein
MEACKCRDREYAGVFTPCLPLPISIRANGDRPVK